MKAHWFQVISPYSFNILTIEFLYNSSIVETQKEELHFMLTCTITNSKGLKIYGVIVLIQQHTDQFLCMGISLNIIYFKIIKLIGHI
jgi:hypothetical protein